MIKENLTSNIEFASWERYLFLKLAEEGFKKSFSIMFIREKTIRDIHLLEWNRIVDRCFIEINELIKKLEIPDNIEAYETVKLMFELALLAFLQEHLDYVMNSYLRRIKAVHKNHQKRKLINQMMREINLEISTTLKLFKFFIELSNLKWINDYVKSETVINEILNLKVKYLRVYGKKYGEDSIQLYGKIFKKNDEYIAKDGESNFRKAARNVIDKNDSKFENKYKAFMKLKNKRGLLSSDEFSKFLSTIDGR